MVVTEDFYDFGTPVSITAPPAGDTAELPLSTGAGSTGSSGTTHA
jgi:hypothetical protein